MISNWNDFDSRKTAYVKCSLTCQNLLPGVSLKHIFWEKILFEIRYFLFLKKAESEFNSVCFYTKLMKIFNSVIKIFKKQILPLLQSINSNRLICRKLFHHINFPYYPATFLKKWILYVVPFGLTLIFMLRMLCCHKNSVYYSWYNLKQVQKSYLYGYFLVSY